MIIYWRVTASDTTKLADVDVSLVLYRLLLVLTLIHYRHFFYLCVCLTGQVRHRRDLIG